MLTGKLDYAKVGLPTPNEKEPFLSGISINFSLITVITVMVYFAAKFALVNGLRNNMGSNAIPITAQPHTKQRKKNSGLREKKPKG